MTEGIKRALTYLRQSSLFTHNTLKNARYREPYATRRHLKIRH